VVLKGLAWPRPFNTEEFLQFVEEFLYAGILDLCGAFEAGDIMVSLEPGPFRNTRRFLKALESGFFLRKSHSSF
jgi:hypothetical protein